MNFIEGILEGQLELAKRRLAVSSEGFKASAEASVVWETMLAQKIFTDYRNLPLSKVVKIASRWHHEVVNIQQHNARF